SGVRPAPAAIGRSLSGSSRSCRSSRIMYSRATQYELDAVSTNRIRTRPVSGSVNDPKGSGTMCPSGRDHAAGIVAYQRPLQVVDGAVAQVAGVLDVKRDGRRAAQLVADVLALDRDVLPALLEAVLNQLG